MQNETQSIARIKPRDLEFTYFFKFSGSQEDWNTYERAGAQILNQGYRPLIGDEIALYLYTHFSELRNKTGFKNIGKITGERPILVFNKNFKTDKGLYVIEDPKAKGLSEKFEESELEKMLKNGKEIGGIRFSRFKDIRFAPIGSYILKKQTPEQLSKNGIVIANFGREGAEKLAEIVKIFYGSCSYVYETPTTRGWGYPSIRFIEGPIIDYTNGCQYLERCLFINGTQFSFVTDIDRLRPGLIALGLRRRTN